jgi:hypothetical protein
MIRAMLLTAASAAALGLVATPAAAAAATSTDAAVMSSVAVQYHCVEPPFEDHDSVTTVTFEAPAVAVLGDDVTISVSFVASFPAPVDIPADGIHGTVDVTVGGAGSGSYTAEGLTSGDPIPTNAPIVMTGGTATIPVSQPGLYTFTPGTLETTNWMGQHTVCTNIEPAPPVAAQTVVTAS